jgi:hypothetical protein
MLSDEEIEKLRLETVANLEELTGDGDCGPGSFYFHEALHMTSVIMDMVETYLMEQPSICTDKDLYRRTNEIYTQLFQLYDELGARHLGPEGDKSGS